MPAAAGPASVRACAATVSAASASDGPEVMMMRRVVSSAANRAATSANDAVGQRRNGLPALTCSTTMGAVAATPAAASRCATRAAASASIGMTTGSAAASGGSMPRGAIKSHWLSTECRGGTSDRDHGTRVVYLHWRPGSA